MVGLSSGQGELGLWLALQVLARIEVMINSNGLYPSTYMDLHIIFAYMCVPPLFPHSHTPTSPHVQDVVTHYAHQNGFHVERRFGWDCHRLPVEYEIDKTLGIKVREGDRLMSTINRQWRQTIMFMCAAVRLHSVICSPGS